MKYEEQFNKFVEQMKKGIDIGQTKYGDEGLFGDSQLEMIKEEARDIACYGYLTWLKVDMLQRKLCKRTDLKELSGEKSINAFDNREDNKC